jgi:DNA-binding beta-propeller fold protein YncE
MTIQGTARACASLLLFCGAMTLAQSTVTIDKDWGQPAGQWDGATSWVDTDGEGDVLVFVRSAPYFRVHDREGHLLKSWGEDGLFRNAHSVTYDPRGFIWATDAGRHVIYKYATDGTLLQTLGTLDQPGDNASHTSYNQPNHVAIAPNGDIYISDGYVNARIVHLSPEGEFIRVIGGVEGSEPGQLKLPHGVVLDSQGRIIVNDSDNQRISVFGPDGVFIESWPFPSRGGIVITEDDTLYVSDVNAGAINVIRNGELLDSIKVDVRPHGLALDSDGTIYASDAMGRTVLKITR